MDPNTGRIYAEDEIQDLPPEIRDRLISGSKEDLEELRKAMLKELVDTEATELGEILDEYEKIKTLPMPDDNKPERFYPVNRAARRAHEKRERKQKFVNKPGKVRDYG